MQQPTFVQHNGAEVLIVDYSHARGDALEQRLAEGARVIRSQPPGSALILVRLAGFDFVPDATKLWLDHIADNRPFSRATAVVGLGHLSKVIPIANRLTGRDLRSFDDEFEALDWLATIAKGETRLDDDKVRFILHGGEDLLQIDFRGSSAADLAARVERAASIIRSQPRHSVLTLTLLHGITYDEATTSLMKDYVRGNKPYVLASAVVGLDYLRRIILPLNRLTGRNLRSFDEIENAKNWLINEKRRLLEQ